MSKLEIIRRLLACPDCRGALVQSGDDFQCEACSRTFPVRDGVPLLFPVSSDEAMVEGQSFYYGHDLHSLRNRLKKIFPLPNFITRRPTLHDSVWDQWVRKAPAGSAILNLGSGVQNEMRHPALINFDIYPHYNTDVAGDAHQLPFLCESLDGVWLCAVLEHLFRPFDVARECFRVLKPGGFVLITVPFIQPRHGSPHDYFRYTLEGVCSVFHQFEMVEGGASGAGPFGTWAQLTMTLVSEVAASRPAIFYGLRFLTGWALYPFALLDKIARFGSVNSSVHGGTSFLGRKPFIKRDTPIHRVE